MPTISDDNGWRGGGVVLTISANAAAREIAVICVRARAATLARFKPWLYSKPYPEKEHRSGRDPRQHQE